MFGCWQIVTNNEEKKEFTGFLNIKNMNGTSYAEIRARNDGKKGDLLFIGHMGYVISIEAV